MRGKGAMWGGPVPSGYNLNKVCYYGTLTILLSLIMLGTRKSRGQIVKINGRVRKIR